MKRLVASRTLIVPMYRTERTETPSAVPGLINVTINHRVPNGEESGYVEVWIDVDSILRRLGAKAMRAKGRKARGMSGDVEVKVVRNTITRTPSA